MHIHVQQKELQECLSHVQNIVERRTSVPVLTHVLLETTEEGHVRVTATDLEHALIQTLPARITQPGHCTLPAHTLYDLVRRFPSEQVFELALNDEGSDQVILRSGRSRFTLPCYPVGHFPPTQPLHPLGEFKLRVAHLRQMIDQTRFAMSTEETRYALNGLYWHLLTEGESSRLCSVATDVHRLARVIVPVPVGAEHLRGMILSRKTVQEVRKIVDDLEADQEISCSFAEGQIQITAENLTFMARLVDGIFPDYIHILERKPHEGVSVPSEPFRQAVDRVAVVASDKTRLIRFKLEPGYLTLSAESPEHGSALEPLDVAYQGPVLEIGFNARYVMDVNQQIKGDQLYLFLNDVSGPTFIQDAAVENALFLIMPMRV